MEMAVTVVTVFASVLAVASALTDIRLFAPQAWIGPDGTLSFADTSAVAVNIAHTFFRTFGLTKPSDTDIIDFCDALGLDERNDLAGLHALYSEPVLIFLEDSTGNAIAFFANNGINVISHYPETRTIFEALLGSSKTAVLAYKPERFLRPQIRNSVAGRFFVPENFRFDTLKEATSAGSQLKIPEAPIVFKESDIPDLYPYLRTSHRNFDIQQIQNAVTKPVPLALSEKAGFPTVFSSKAASTSANQATETTSSETVKTSNALTTNNFTTEGLQSLFVRNPLACARFARAVEDSGLPVSEETSSTAMKAASYLADEAADYVLKALLARNPEVGARIARQALKEYNEVNGFYRTGYIHSAPASTYNHVPTATSTFVPTYTSTHPHSSSSSSTHIPTPTFSHISTPTSTHMPTSTSSYIPASTLTHIPTSSSEHTPTHIPATTPTNTFIPISTHTPTSSPTHIPTNPFNYVPIPTSTHIPTSTFTYIPPPTSTHVPTPTPTHIPTSTSTHIPTPTPTHIPTPTPTHIPTSTSTHIPTPTCRHMSTPPSTSASTHTSTPKTPHTSSSLTQGTPASTALSTSTSTSSPGTMSSSTSDSACLSEGKCAEPQLYMYDPVTSKIYRLVTTGGTLPAIVPGNSTIPDNIPENATKILMTEPTKGKEAKSDSRKGDKRTKHQTTNHVTEQKQVKETKSEGRKAENRAHNKHQLTPYEYLRRSFSGSPQFTNSGHMLSALNTLNK